MVAIRIFVFRKFGFSDAQDSDFLNPLVRGTLIDKKAGSTDTALPVHSIRDGFLGYSSLAALYAVRMALAISAVRSPEQSPTQVTGTLTPSRSNALALEPTAITT